MSDSATEPHDEYPGEQIIPIFENFSEALFQVYDLVIDKLFKLPEDCSEVKDILNSLESVITMFRDVLRNDAIYKELLHQSLSNFCYDYKKIFETKKFKMTDKLRHRIDQDKQCITYTYISLGMPKNYTDKFVDAILNM